MRKLLLVVALLAAGCGSTAPADVAPASTVPARDPQLTDLQKSLTELLERLDVMNDRITKLEVAATAGPQMRTAEASGAPLTPNPSPVVGAAQRAVVGASIADKYRNGVALVAQNKPREARAIFQQVFDADPSGDLADNALFWIGETYYTAGDYQNAMTFYRRVSEEFGDQNKAPDALYKMALAQEKTGDLILARQTLQSVISRYPYSSPASSARAELNRIKY